MNAMLAAVQQMYCHHHCCNQLTGRFSFPACMAADAISLPRPTAFSAGQENIQLLAQRIWCPCARSMLDQPTSAAAAARRLGRKAAAFPGAHKAHITLCHSAVAASIEIRLLPVLQHKVPHNSIIQALLLLYSINELTLSVSVRKVRKFDNAVLAYCNEKQCCWDQQLNGG